MKGKKILTKVLTGVAFVVLPGAIPAYFIWYLSSYIRKKKHEEKRIV